MPKVTTVKEEDLQEKKKEEPVDITEQKIRYLQHRQNIKSPLTLTSDSRSQLYTIITLICVLFIAYQGRNIYLKYYKSEVVTSSVKLTDVILDDIETYPLDSVPFLGTKNYLSENKQEPPTADDIKNILSELSESELNELFTNYSIYYSEYSSNDIVCALSEDNISLYAITDEGNKVFLDFYKYETFSEACIN